MASKNERLNLIVKGNHENPLQGLIDLYQDGEIDLKEVQFQIPLPPKLRSQFRSTVFEQNIVHGINLLSEESVNLIQNAYKKHCDYTGIDMQIISAWESENDLCVQMDNDKIYHYSQSGDWYKEKIDRNVMINKAGGNAGKDSKVYRLSLSIDVIKELGITVDDKAVEVLIRDNEIVIKKKI